MSVKVKKEIKHLKYSTDMGVLEYKINNPKKNNGCVLSFVALPILEELKEIIDLEIEKKKKSKKR